MLEVLGTKLLLKLAPEEEGSIIVDDVESPKRGVVVSVGHTVESNLTPEDIVWFFEPDATQFKKDKEVFYVIEEDDILLVERIDNDKS